LDQQIATSDVLKIISRSSVDLETVLDTLVETVMRLCRADQAYMWRSRDKVYQLLASCGLSDDAKAYFLTHPPKVDRGTVCGRVALEGQPVHVPDVLKDPEYTYIPIPKGRKSPGSELFSVFRSCGSRNFSAFSALTATTPIRLPTKRSNWSPPLPIRR
jgi:hypothetical protein